MRARSAAERRYLRRLAAATLCYLLFLIAAVRLVGGGAVSGLPAFALAALPGLAVAGIFWAAARLLIEEQDEYLRMLLVRQALVASGFALSVATVIGFLESFGLIEQLDGFYVAILWFLGLGIGALFNRTTIGTGVDCR